MKIKQEKQEENIKQKRKRRRKRLYRRKKKKRLEVIATRKENATVTKLEETKVRMILAKNKYRSVHSACAGH